MPILSQKLKLASSIFILGSSNYINDIQQVNFIDSKFSRLMLYTTKYK